MKKINETKTYISIVVSVIFFLAVSIFSFVSIRQLQGHARVINYDGIVRGATQKLVKMEIQNSIDGTVNAATRDTLILRLDSILVALNRGGVVDGDKKIIVLPDKVHQEHISELLESWEYLKVEINNVRDGKPTNELYRLSEAYFIKANSTVFAAENYSEAQVNSTTSMLVGVNVVFVIYILITCLLIIKSIRTSKEANILGKIAYIDPLTSLNNRASCEKEILKFKQVDSDKEILVAMFDMNNLKKANDALGHQAGDKIIINFSKILADNAKDYGFIGRYGGDEFLGIFEKANDRVFKEYISGVDKKINEYNSTQVNEIEKISYAAGISFGSLAEKAIDDRIYEADRNMYEKKREMKKYNS
jgi:diguanylate cyclase (GGDEF)-like protein